MNEEEAAFVEGVKGARGTAAELKLSLVSLRADLPDAMIFVFEGDDDRGVYFSWVRYIDSSFRYEPFTCKGKDGVLRLKQAVDRDVGDLRRNVYFFIDRDFDDSRGATLDDSIYMTDYYSIENYLVSEDVLDEILKIEFHCQGQLGARSKVIFEFNRLYDKFLEVTKSVNLEIYAVRRLNIELEKPLCKSIGKLATVSLADVVRSAKSDEEIVRPKRSVTTSEFDELSEPFNALDPRKRYRGKFAVLFFMKWLEILAHERCAQATELFAGLNADVKVHYGRLSVVTLAARSTPPQSFRDFFDRISPA